MTSDGPEHRDAHRHRIDQPRRTPRIAAGRRRRTAVVIGGEAAAAALLGGTRSGRRRAAAAGRCGCAWRAGPAAGAAGEGLRRRFDWSAPARAAAAAAAGSASARRGGAGIRGASGRRVASGRRAVSAAARTGLGRPRLRWPPRGRCAPSRPRRQRRNPASGPLRPPREPRRSGVFRGLVAMLIASRPYSIPCRPLSRAYSGARQAHAKPSTERRKTR